MKKPEPIHGVNIVGAKIVDGKPVGGRIVEDFSHIRLPDQLQITIFSLVRAILEREAQGDAESEQGPSSTN